MSRHPAIPYVAPFAVFLAFLALDRVLPFSPVVVFTLRFVTVLATLIFVSRHVIPTRVNQFWLSVILGVAVFAIWIGPDVLWPNYRRHWLFTNSLMGAPKSSIDPLMKLSPLFILVRVLSSVVNVPILEELFWRGWLMRWLIDRNFLKVPLGAYTPYAFWMVALLFASEHGSYWDVGLVTGVIYNWWIVKTRNLANCILTHAVTNACLAIYVVARDQWQYWL
jgi:CAAX prenyl protease-like protein